MKSINVGEYEINDTKEIKLKGGKLVFNTYYPIENKPEEIDGITLGLDYLGLFDSIK